MIESSFFTSFDGLKLHYRFFLNPQAKATLVFLHGLNEHAGRYVHVFERFKDFNIWFYEQRGHGHSDGERSYVGQFGDYVKDFHAFLALVREKEKRQKVFAIGHSMGGQVLLNYLGTHEHGLAGFITSSPNIKLKIRMSPVERFVGDQLGKKTPHLRLPSKVSPKFLSHDPEVVLAYKKDPLIPKYLTAGLAREMIFNQQDILALAPKIACPALMLHAGEDYLCAKQGSADFFEKLVSTDKELKIYDGFYHELFNEIGKKEVFQDMRAWLEKRA